MGSIPGLDILLEVCDAGVVVYNGWHIIDFVLNYVFPLLMRSPGPGPGPGPDPELET